MDGLLTTYNKISGQDLKTALACLEQLLGSPDTPLRITPQKVLTTHPEQDIHTNPDIALTHEFSLSRKAKCSSTIGFLPIIFPTVGCALVVRKSLLINITSVAAWRRHKQGNCDVLGVSGFILLEIHGQKSNISSK